MLSRFKKIIPLILLVLIITLILLLSINNKTNYVIKVSKIDEHSPARILKVYNGNKEVKFKEIRYSDDVFLCNNANPTAFYGDIENEKKLKVIINDNKYVMAEIVEGGENEK